MALVGEIDLFFLLEYIATCGMLSSLDDRLMISGDKDGWGEWLWLL